jgi:hypothetical protein
LALPDCRAYEMVTPAYKEGNNVQVQAIAPDGERMVGNSTGAFAGTENDKSSEIGTAGAHYELARTPAGWLTTPLEPSLSSFPASGILDESSDLEQSLWRLRTPAQAAGTGELYLRDASSAFTPIGPLQPPPGLEGGFGGEFNYLGSSPNLSRVLFSKRPEAPGGLWPGDGTQENKSLYQYTGTGQVEPELVAVANEGPLASNAEAQLISRCGADLGGVGTSADRYNAISATGATVFFTARECEGQPASDELFARVDRSRTVAISEPSTQDCSECLTTAPLSAQFAGASEDGSKAFFITEQELLPGATGTNLYEYDFARPAGQRIVLVSRSPSEAAAVQGVARISEDGSYAYFIARGELTSTPNARGEQAEAGAENLYAFETAGDRLAFVGQLSEADELLWQQSDEERPVEATPDGRFLVFSSSAALTGAEDTSTVAQLFEYDAATGSLTRISIGEDGWNDNGNTDSEAEAPLIRAPNYGVDNPTAAASSLTMSDDGSYVFFESADSLTELASSGLPSVYEYHDGHVYLIAAGHDPAALAVGLIGTDASGADVFFYDSDQLVPQDTDTQRDIYDARVDVGFEVTPQAGSCEADACQGALSIAPTILPGASTTQVAGENLRPPASRPAAKRPKGKPKKKAAKKKAHRGKRAAERRRAGQHAGRAKAKRARRASRTAGTVGRGRA